MIQFYQFYKSINLRSLNQKRVLFHFYMVSSNFKTKIRNRVYFVMVKGFAYKAM